MKRKTVGQRLKQIMDERGLKQVDIIELSRPFFTDKVKISKTDLSQYVNDKAEPRSDKLYILSKGLGVPEQWLLGFDSDKDNQEIHKKLTVDEAVDNLMPYQGRPVSDDQKAIIKDLIKGYLDRSNKNE